MAMSVHTNEAALVALQNLNKTANDLHDVQNRISPGLQINSANDNASVLAIAQGQPADIGSLAAAEISLDRAPSIADVASTAGQAISDLLVHLNVMGLGPV